MLIPAIGLCALGWSICRPSISQRYCCAVSFLTSSPFRGHWKLPLSSRLYSRRNPSPSQYNPLIRSCLLPQNRNSVLVNGSSWNWLCTNAASPSIPLRKSVYPQAMYTFSAPLKSLSMTSASSPPALKLPYPLLQERPRKLLLCES